VYIIGISIKYANSENVCLYCIRDLGKANQQGMENLLKESDNSEI